MENKQKNISKPNLLLEPCVQNKSQENGSERKSNLRDGLPDDKYIFYTVSES